MVVTNLDALLVKSLKFVMKKERTHYGRLITLPLSFTLVPLWVSKSVGGATKGGVHISSLKPRDGTKVNDHGKCPLVRIIVTEIAHTSLKRAKSTNFGHQSGKIWY